MLSSIVLPAVLALAISPASAVVIHAAVPDPTPPPSEDILKRQDFEIPETTANPDNPFFQGYISGDPNQPLSCSQGSTAFLQASGGFACCQGNCGTYTAPTACVQGGDYSGPHTSGLTTNCANSFQPQCNTLLYDFPEGQYRFAFCSDNPSPETVTILRTTNDNNVSPPTTTSSPPYTPPSTTSTPSPPPPTSSEPTTSSAPPTSSNPTTTSSSPVIPTQSSGSPVPPTPATTTPGPNTGSPTPAPAGKSSSHVGAIAGGVVGGVVGIALIAGLVVFFLFRRRRNQQRPQYQDDYYPRPQSPPPFPSNFPSGGTGGGGPPTLPQPTLGAGEGALSEKFSSIENIQATGVSSATSPAMSQGQTASPTVSSGFGTQATNASELQGSGQTSYPNRGDQGTYDVHEMPGMSHKALPTTSPLYHELQ